MPWLIRVAIGARSLLFGRAIDWRSVWLLRADTAESPGILPPIRASRAREAARHDWWLELVAELLAEGARFPEPRGRWQLTPMATADGTARSYRSLDPDELPAPAYALDHTLERPSLFEEPWHVRGSCIVLPLRETSDADAGRVKAWRKHARDGTLPPILILHVPALDVHVVLDGHDRLRAALLEGVAPLLVALWRPRADLDPPALWLRARREESAIRYERVLADRDRPRSGTVDGLNRDLVDVFRPHWWRGDPRSHALDLPGALAPRRASPSGGARARRASDARARRQVVRSVAQRSSTATRSRRGGRSRTRAARSRRPARARRSRSRRTERRTPRQNRGVRREWRCRESNPSPKAVRDLPSTCVVRILMSLRRTPTDRLPSSPSILFSHPHTGSRA